MDIDLRLPSGEHDKEEEEPNGIVNMLDANDKLRNGDEGNGSMVDFGDELNIGDGRDMNSPAADMVFKEDTNLEPLSDMEFESHGDAYSFYQEYARSMGFNTAIQNSRRSKTSREFIDAKFACSRYGTKREYEKSQNRQRSRQGNKQEAENSTGRRSCTKTDCKACMHVKRRPDGKWIIHRFEKEHNHELLPAQAVSEQTRKMYAAMARQFAEYKNVVGLKNDSKHPYDKGRNLTLEAGEGKVLLEFFTQMQIANSNFFYAIDISEDQRLKSLFWVDAKSRHDYINFSDVVSFDTTYVRNKYKMPLILFIGANQHYQFMLLGCALVADESVATFSWVLQTWLKAMGGQAPKVIITDQDRTMKTVVSEHVSGLYTHAVFKKFQTEVLGAVACHPKRERQEGTTTTFRVQDFEKNQDFTVTWNEKSEVSCVCRLFEFKGFLCRHALIVLQICGLSTIPCQYILKRWTKDAKSRCLTGESSEHVQSRVQRYNDLCQRAMKMGEEGSLSQESYNYALRGLEDTYGNCVGVNNSNKNLGETGTSVTAGLLCIEEDQSRSMSKTNRKKNPTKKRKVNSEQDVMTVGTEDSLQQMEKLTARPGTLDGYFSPQQSMQGMVQLNLMAPTRDNYYGTQQTIQGLGQLNSIAPNHDGYYNPQPTLHGLGQMDFFRTQAGFTYGIREDPNLRPAQLHDDASRRA
ncbi:hypothetical protein RHGRI_010290 [Rhododendron griersonianum]|uniref:Protein FAR1-RELATED SEQUENCE n=1 Tax=Rhododendron griersonianum TaxID=479676 RepID=A0AAV6KIR8_9ERIC|nr:hypothetical protein RHGRI_010290 [Rhododendron griersonianum]